MKNMLTWCNVCWTFWYVSLWVWQPRRLLLGSVDLFYWVLWLPVEALLFWLQSLVPEKMCAVSWPGCLDRPPVVPRYKAAFSLARRMPLRVTLLVLEHWHPFVVVGLLGKLPGGYPRLSGMTHPALIPDWHPFREQEIGGWKDRFVPAPLSSLLSPTRWMVSQRHLQSNRCRLPPAWTSGWLSVCWWIDRQEEKIRLLRWELAYTNQPQH